MSTNATGLEKKSMSLRNVHLLNDKLLKYECEISYVVIKGPTFDLVATYVIKLSAHTMPRDSVVNLDSGSSELQSEKIC